MSKSAKRIEPTYPELASYLARELLAMGDSDIVGECQRIQFKLGPYGHEKDGGGMCESALVEFFARRLAARSDLVVRLINAYENPLVTP